VILGAGVGWDRDEFAALGVPFSERGARADELIELIAHLHAAGEGGFGGRFHHVGDGVFAPRPSTRVPLMVGGTSDAALRRAARVGDLWQAYGVTPAQFRALHTRLRAMAGERTVAAGTIISAPPNRDASQLAADVEAWRAAGAEHLAVHPGALDGAAERLSSLAERVPELLVR